MNGKKNVAMLGVCDARLIPGFARTVQETEGLYENINVMFHFVLPCFFFQPNTFNYLYSYDSDMKSFTLAPPEKVPDDFLPHERAGAFAWHLGRFFENGIPGMPKKNTIPAADDSRRDWIYCLTGMMWPSFPPHSITRPYWDLIKTIEAGEIEASVNFIADHYLHYHKPVLTFLLKLKEAGLNVMMIEPIRVMPIKGELDDMPVDIYKKTVGIERTIIKMALKQYEVPFLELGREYVDENGFTPLQYRYDFMHTTQEFGLARTRELLQFIDSNFKCTGEGGRLRYDPLNSYSQGRDSNA